MQSPWLVPCAGPATGGTWRNHGHYVSSVAKAAEECLEAGLITEEQRYEIVSQAARSKCGKRYKKAANRIEALPPGNPGETNGPASGLGSPGNKPTGP